MVAAIGTRCRDRGRIVAIATAAISGGDQKGHSPRSRARRGDQRVGDHAVRQHALDDRGRQDRPSANVLKPWLIHSEQRAQAQRPASPSAVDRSRADAGCS